MEGRGEAEHRGYLFPHMANECNPDDARALALVKAPEDPPTPGPLLQ